MTVPPIPRQDAEYSENYIWVKELIIQEDNQWNASLVQQLFDSETANLILQMRIPTATKGKLIWNLTRNGHFSLKSAYNKLHEISLGDTDVSLMIQNTEIQWKEMWNIQIWPRVKHFWWKCLAYILPTNVRLSLRMLIPGGSSATTGHYDDIATIFEAWMKTAQHTSSDSRWLHLAMIVSWSIWNKRCEVHFQKKKANPEAVARRAMSFASYLEGLNSKQQTRTMASHHIKHSLLWKPPASPFFTINCDASYDKNTKLTGIAHVLRDFAGKWQGSASKCYAGVKDSEHAECLAFLEAVRWSKDRLLTHVVFETHLQGIESYITKQAPVIAWKTKTFCLMSLSV
ncbi:uncharacterized protein LOC113280738 [Papaver somniferum]|uniref:uncharacterized protein LOC113280738 n=1 Tax=Papaver somniferum TaxID=3469 RepID=UPI000E705E18|nr:uncharacterized protein LOC113280738 [Papaver somniferum]